MAEVDAEIIEEKNLSIQFTPATIISNFDDVEAHIKNLVGSYATCEFQVTDEKSYKEAKSARSYLNSIVKDIDNRVRAVANEYEAPLKAFKEKAKEVTSVAREASERSDAAIKEYEERCKDEKIRVLEEHYQEFAPLLCPVVPFERLFDKKWLNRTCVLGTAQFELDQKIEKIATDWEALKKSGVNSPAVEARFFDTLDLGDAVSYGAKLAEDAKRIDELKQAMEEVEEIPEVVEEEPEPVEEIHEPEIAEPMPLEAPEIVSEAVLEPKPIQAPEPVPMAPVMGSHQYTADEVTIEDQPIVEVPEEPSFPWVIVITSATNAQMLQVASMLGNMNLEGRAIRGTFEEAWRRENG